MKKNAGKVWSVNKKPYLCNVKNKTGGFVERLDYGVMVTQQILVLFFQVRVLVVQQVKTRRPLKQMLWWFFFLFRFVLLVVKKIKVDVSTSTFVFIPSLIRQSLQSSE